MKHEEVVQMSFLSNLVKKYKRATPKQFVLAGVFALALAAAIGGGFASKQSSHALQADQTIRDCGYNSSTGVFNSIDYETSRQGCGALTMAELCSDLTANRPGDLHSIYAEFGFTAADCTSDRISQAYRGVVKTNGDLVVSVNGRDELMMTNAWTMGRTTLNGVQRTEYVINGRTYYHSPATASLARDLDVIVMFDGDGTVKFAVMESCGNPITRGNKVRPEFKCDDLKKTPVDGEKNTYEFTTKTVSSNENLAKPVKFEYFYNDGNGDKKFGETTNGSTPVKKTFTKAARVFVKVTFSLPGGHTATKECEKEVGVVKEEFLHVCEALTKTVIDTKTFRFNAVDKHSDNVKLVSVDFTLDGSTTVKGVKTDDDDDGHIDRTYHFEDNKAHSVSAVINFEVEDKIVQSKESCVAATPETPVCPEKPNLPPDHPDCHELPKTGPAGVAGLFAGITAAGAVGHRLFVNYRSRRG